MHFKCINTIEEFKSMEKDWNRLVELSFRPSIFLTHHWFLSWWEAFGSNGLLNILAVYKKNNLLGIVPLRRENDELYFLASPEVSDYCEFIAARGEEKETTAAFIGYLQQKRKEIKSVKLINIPPGSKMLQFLPEFAAKSGFKAGVFTVNHILRLKLPPSFEVFLSSLNRKHRHELRRKSRRLNAYSDLFVEAIKEPARIKKEMGNFIDLHRSKKKEREIFWRKKGMTEFFIKLTERLAWWGKLELLVLFNKEEPVAYLIQFFYENTVSLYNVAYNRKFSSLSPGIFLFQEAIRRAIERKMEIVDFLRGKEKYKLSFSPKSDKIYNLMLISGD